MAVLKGLLERRPETAAAVLFFVAHLPFLGLAELSGDESLYWLCGQHPAWGYLTNPPLVGWVAAAGPAILGDTAFAVRLGFLVVASAGFAGLFVLGAELGGGRRFGWRALGVFIAVPLAWLYGFMAAPDVLLVALVAAGLAAAVRACGTGEVALWLLGGVFLGLAVLAKYTACLIVMLVVVIAVASRERRTVRGGLLLAAAAAAAAGPHLGWLLGRDLGPLRLRLDVHTAEDVPGFIGSSGAHFFLTQLVVWSPLVVAALAAALVALVRGGPSPARAPRWTVAGSVLVPGVAFSVYALRHPVHPYWTAVALPAAAAALAAWLGTLVGSRRRVVWRVLIVQAAVLIGVAAVSLFGGGRGEGYLGERLSWAVGENTRLAERVRSELPRFSRPPLIATTRGYATATQIAFELGRENGVLALAPVGVARQLREWERPSWTGRPALVAVPGCLGAFPLAAYFESCDDLEPLELPGRRFELHACRGYTGRAPKLWRTWTGPPARELVHRLYRGLLGRDPEPTGLQSSLDALVRGELVHRVWMMSTSPEAERRAGTMTLEERARQLVRELTGAPPSDRELAAAVDVARWGGLHGLALRLVTERASSSDIQWGLSTHTR